MRWLERQFGARVSWLPFDLHPEYPPTGLPRAELIAKYGATFHERLSAQFAEEGLVYAPNPDVVPNTRLALELGEGARVEGLHRQLHDRLMDAYWAEGLDLSDRALLSRLAAEIGMSAEGIARALDDRVWSADVDGWTQQSRVVGASGVPAFVIDRRVLVVGAESREVLADAIAQARADA